MDIEGKLSKRGCKTRVQRLILFKIACTYVESIVRNRWNEINSAICLNTHTNELITFRRPDNTRNWRQIVELSLRAGLLHLNLIYEACNFKIYNQKTKTKTFKGKHSSRTNNTLDGRTIKFSDILCLEYNRPITFKYNYSVNRNYLNIYIWYF